MRGKETPFAGLRCADAHSGGGSGCVRGWDGPPVRHHRPGTTGPAHLRTAAAAAAAARALLPPTSPFDAVAAGATGLNRHTGLFAEVTHLRRERVACSRVLFHHILPGVCASARVVSRHRPKQEIKNYNSFMRTMTLEQTLRNK